MKLNKIEIENFRCFQHFALEFAPGATVLIGRNGTGKTSLIRSITNALSFIFATSKDPKINEVLVAGNPDLKIANISPSEVWWDETERTSAGFVSIKSEANFEGEELSWELMKPSTSNSGLRTGLYQNAYNAFVKRYNITGKWPLLAFYSDSFPNVVSRISKFAKDMLAKDGISLRNFGYYQWDDETSCSSIWQIRYQNCYTKWLTNKQQEELVANEIKVLKNLDKYTVVELEKKEKELAALRTETEGNFREWNTILTCLKRFSEVTTGYTDSTFEVKSLQSEQRGTEWKLVIKMDDKSIIFDQLPAGYKRLYYIVFDIAYRSFILNGNADSSGVVLIDELDLHLHPSLEQEVLQRFMNTFPNIQFIVSTHSPLVISNLNTQEKNASGDSRNRVYRMVMGQKKPDILPNMFGVDYSTSMSDFMNTPSRNLQVKELIDDYVILKYQKLEDKAQNVYNKIMKTVGEDNQAVLAEIEDKLKELETL
ncbi:DUF2813 domain-containing protein [Bacteroides intestinalis]|uniref:DUF2813 domain-containing protein n=1 Tax=Bacteroides intestinalis TaxID=329854 RepID=A0A412YIJ8_9BACE|nr:AAA family ATPase [Bacteroides intestinalis]RGV57250.1 DUF2813 domain-containing protein [Bacteroides intestinalis]RHA61660.1 DUF2813 domain-containing protein [Bacteroides intestinalis]